MNAIVKSLIAISIAASFSMNAYADERKPDSREQKRDKFEQMRPAERQDMRQEMRREHNEIAPNERREMREKMHERFEKMSPHERREMRQDLRHRGHQDNRRYYASVNGGNAHIVLGGNHGRVIERVEFRFGF
jgi:hypothetical protein